MRFARASFSFWGWLPGLGPGLNLGPARTLPPGSGHPGGGMFDLSVPVSLSTAGPSGLAARALGWLPGLGPGPNLGPARTPPPGVRLPREG